MAELMPAVPCLCNFQAFINFDCFSFIEFEICLANKLKMWWVRKELFVLPYYLYAYTTDIMIFKLNLTNVQCSLNLTCSKS